MSDSVKKTNFGYELTWAKTDEYCGKILVFEKSNSVLPLHFHKTKTKSWFVNSGKFLIKWVDTSDGKPYSQELSEGNVFHVNPMTPITVESLTDNGAIAEVSNGHDDYYRLG